MSEPSTRLDVVKVRLVDGTLLTLHSVPVGEVPSLRQLLEQSRGVPEPAAPAEPPHR